MAKLTIDTDMQPLPDVVPGTLMIHKDQPPFIVLATSIVIGDEFAGVSLPDGGYGEQWVIGEYSVFQGTLKLEQ
jgi:hypothetical protein